MLRKVSSYIVSVFLFVSISLFIISMSTIALLDYQTYDQAFTETGGYYEAEELFMHVGYVLTPDQQRGVLKNMLAYIQGEPEQPIVVQQGFTDEQIIAWIDEMPPCVDDQQYCKPQGTSDEVLFAAARHEFGEPEPYDLLHDTDTSVKEQLDSARNLLQYVKIITTTALIIGLVSMFLIMFLNRRHLKSGLRWIDSDLIVAGGASVITAVSLLNYLPVMITQNTADIEIGASIIKAVFLVLSSTLGAMLWYGIGALALGVIILIASIFVPNVGNEKLLRKQ